MSVYYEKLIDLYEAGKIPELIACSEKWEKEERLREEEMIVLKRIMPSWLANLEGDLDFNNPEIIFIFYHYLREMKRRTDEKLCKEFAFGKENIEDIKHRRRIRSKKTGAKIAREFFWLLRKHGQNT